MKRQVKNVIRSGRGFDPLLAMAAGWLVKKGYNAIRGAIERRKAAKSGVSSPGKNPEFDRFVGDTVTSNNIPPPIPTGADLKKLYASYGINPNDPSVNRQQLSNTIIQKAKKLSGSEYVNQLVTKAKKEVWSSGVTQVEKQNKMKELLPKRSAGSYYSDVEASARATGNDIPSKAIVNKILQSHGLEYAPSTPTTLANAKKRGELKTLAISALHRKAQETSGLTNTLKSVYPPLPAITADNPWKNVGRRNVSPEKLKDVEQSIGKANKEFNTILNKESGGKGKLTVKQAKDVLSRYKATH